MEQGVVFGSRVLGYYLKNGKLAINEDEAKTVRLIYNLYLSGKGIHLLCQELENRAIAAPNGGMRWYAASVLSMLKNEKYSGTLKQRKHITTDYLSHKVKTNYGEENYITIENNHAPIISKEIFDSTQKELVRRRNAALEKSRYSSRYPFSGKIECANCKSKFERRHNSQKTDKRQTVWRCAEAVKYGKEKINAQGQKVGCNCKSVHERFLQENFLAVLNSVIENKDVVVQTLKGAVREAIDNCPSAGAELREVMAGLDKVSVKKSKLIDIYLDGLVKRPEYEKAFAGYDKQQKTLQKRLSELDSENKIAQDLAQKLDNIDQAIENLARLKEFGDSVCLEVLAKVVVEGRDKVSFYLKTDEKADMFVKIPLSPSQYQQF
jgi:hypothetical protein